MNENSYSSGQQAVVDHIAVGAAKEFSPRILSSCGDIWLNWAKDRE
jgi:hypothetical protein